MARDYDVDSQKLAAGQVHRVTEGHPVDLDCHYLDPRGVDAQLAHAGLSTTAKLDRRRMPAIEYPSRRRYLVAQRR